MYFSQSCLYPAISSRFQHFVACYDSTESSQSSPHSHRSFVNKKGVNVKFVTQLAHAPSGEFFFFPCKSQKKKDLYPYLLSLLFRYAAVFICHVVLAFRRVFCLQAGCIKVAHDIDMKTSLASLATTTTSRFGLAREVV
jgi:hypothetical protein